jgi:uncharacterized Zn finger protein (UPF0148 family)
MPKGYIKFEDFQKQTNKRKPHLPLCPRCKQPMEFVTHNKFGKVMCANCLAEEEQKFANRKQPVVEEEIDDDEYTGRIK